MLEVTIVQNFDYDSIINFYVARYSYEGEYKGFARVDRQLHMCSAKNDIVYIWKEFGKSYYSECDVDITDLFAGTSDFMEMFFADHTASGKQVLRPVPILVRNYKGSENSENDKHRWTFFRRFFLYENSSNSPRTLRFTWRSRGKTTGQFTFLI